jgi:DNA-directed RNA polymerase subunit RPC12/RpoP
MSKPDRYAPVGGVVRDRRGLVCAVCGGRLFYVLRRPVYTEGGVEQAAYDMCARCWPRGRKEGERLEVRDEMRTP